MSSTGVLRKDDRTAPPPRFLRKPVYLQVRDALIERIANGGWKPGQTIPNEGNLARELGVSPGTVRKALDRMESERVLTRRQGHGTYVNDPAANGLADRFCGIRGADGEPVAGRVEVIEIIEAPATREERLRLLLGRRDPVPVWRMRRTRCWQQRVFMHEDVSLPGDLFPGLGGRATGRIVFLAQQHGLVLGRAEERVSLGHASRCAAEALCVAEGSPVLVLDRVTCTIEGRPVEWRVGQCLPGVNYYLARLP